MAAKSGLFRVAHDKRRLESTCLGDSILANVRQTAAYQGLKKVTFLRRIVWKMRKIRREIAWTARAIKSGTFLAYLKANTRTGKAIDQKVLRHEIDLPFLADHAALQEWLAEKRIEFRTGAFCIYLPPQEMLVEVFGKLLAKYPADAGLKVLKDLKTPAKAKYVDRAFGNVARFDDLTSNKPLELIRVANYLFDHEVGPRVYDLIELKTPHNQLSAYVVQDVAGGVPTEGECQKFIEQLKVLFDDQLLPFPDWQIKEDFRCPDCKGNLLKDPSSGKLMYIDFQSFMMKDNLKYIDQIAADMKDDVHFGDQHWLRGGRYLYQSIPGLHVGQRMINERWDVFSKLLADTGAELDGNVVYDIGCNMGMMIQSALANGARWAIGWDRPYVIPHSRKLLLAMGMTRFDLFAKDIDAESEFAPQLPPHAMENNGAILFYLAMRKHIGFPDGVNRLPFEFMLYEGHENETLADTEEYLREIEEKWDLENCGIIAYQDGDSHQRFAAGLRRRS